jgi:hypothetical protein
MSKPITMLDLCKAHPEKAAERIEALIKRNADIERSLNIDNCMIDNLRSVKAEMEVERYLKDKRIAELENERGAAVFLAEQRRQFIVNGVELGYIPHPTIEEDKAANLTILMCGFDDSHSMEAHNLVQHDKGVDKAIAELTICYRVALDEHKDYEDAEVLEGLIDRLQALKDPS